jgi:DNA-binding NtrC family response regulator
MSSPTRVLSFSPAPASARPSGETRDNTRVLLGPSSTIARLWSQIRLLAPHFRVALLTGEPGTGAESVAQALHDLSPFADAPLLKLRASEAEHQLRHPATLLNGSARGTIFISEIDRLSRNGQEALLRVVRLRRHRRIGVIAAISRDLRSLISTGAFSPELASQLSAVRLALPPLRERADDIPLLINHLFQNESALLDLPVASPDATFLARATQQAWPGNLDQLRAVIVWLLRNCGQATLTSADLDAALAEVHAEPVPPEPVVRMISLDHVVQEHVRAVLVGCNGNKLRAAEVLGISRSTLYRMLDAADADPSNSFALAG